jgi:hypothetical protein
MSVICIYSKLQLKGGRKEKGKEVRVSVRKKKKEKKKKNKKKKGPMREY